MDRLWKIPVSVTALFATGMAFADDPKKQVECWNWIDDDKHIAMTLPIGEHQSTVTMTLNGMDFRALYLVEGMEQRWVIDPAKNGNNYLVILGANLIAGYYDFSNVAEGEETTAEALFQCRIGNVR